MYPADSEEKARSGSTDKLEMEPTPHEGGCVRHEQRERERETRRLVQNRTKWHRHMCSNNTKIIVLQESFATTLVAERHWTPLLGCQHKTLVRLMQCLAFKRSA